jgi:hypothetical protein
MRARRRRKRRAGEKTSRRRRREDAASSSSTQPPQSQSRVAVRRRDLFTSAQGNGQGAPPARAGERCGGPDLRLSLPPLVEEGAAPTPANQGSGRSWQGGEQEV